MKLRRALVAVLLAAPAAAQVREAAVGADAAAATRASAFSTSVRPLEAAALTPSLSAAAAPSA